MSAYLLSLVLFGEGFLTGLTLTAMLGPVTMIIFRYGIQVNRMAGVWTAIGTWVSDFVFIAITYWMTTSVNEWTESPNVRLWIYLLGGFGLFLMGVMMTMVKRKSFTPTDTPASGSYVKAFVSGFIVNSLSPFTLFFWIGAAVFLHLQSDNPIWYYFGLMLSLATGDFLKAWMAPKLTHWIKDSYVYWVQVIAGILIALIGIYIVVLGFIE